MDITKKIDKFLTEEEVKLNELTSSKYDPEQIKKIIKDKNLEKDISGVFFNPELTSKSKVEKLLSEVVSDLSITVLSMDEGIISFEDNLENLVKVLKVLYDNNISYRVGIRNAGM